MRVIGVIRGFWVIRVIRVMRVSGIIRVFWVIRVISASWLISMWAY